MWGKLTEFVQDKLESSISEEDTPTEVRFYAYFSQLGHWFVSSHLIDDIKPVHWMLFVSQQSDAKIKIENLRKALSEAEGRNENISREFKKLLREKEVC